MVSKSGPDLTAKLGHAGLFFFMNMHRIFIEKLQGAKCRSRWSRLVKPEKHQRCCFWEIGIMEMGLVFRTALCQQNDFLCLFFQGFFLFIMKAETWLVSGFQVCWEFRVCLMKSLLANEFLNEKKKSANINTIYLQLWWKQMRRACSNSAQPSSQEGSTFFQDLKVYN